MKKEICKHEHKINEIPFLSQCWLLDINDKCKYTFKIIVFKNKIEEAIV